jgi:hypothetical protein
VKREPGVQTLNQKDWRRQSFLAKFQAAAVELNAASHRDVESLKFRGSTSSQEYRELLAELGPLKVVEIQGNYQGKAWKLTNADDNSIIIVEHETGLEILYVVGALASIVSLVPLVVNVWNRMRDHWPPYRGRFGPGGPEKRHFNRKDRLIEEPAPPVEVIMLHHLLNQHDRLSARISSLETEVSNLKSHIETLRVSGAKKKRTKSTSKKNNKPSDKS